MIEEDKTALSMAEWIKKSNEQYAKSKIEERGRKDFPHVAVLTFRIEVRELNNDGLMGESVLSDNELNRYGMSGKAQIHIKGATESECIQKVKNTLENINAG